MVGETLIIIIDEEEKKINPYWSIFSISSRLLLVAI
jgi:hypothetical protein